MSELKFTRRQLGRLGLVGAGAVLAGGSNLLARVARAAEEKGILDYPANKPIFTAVMYVEKSVQPGKHCALCQLFTPGTGGRGKCALFQQGTVNQNGYCTSFSPKAQ